jgi:hypothetical protein
MIVVVDQPSVKIFRDHSEPKSSTTTNLNENELNDDKNDNHVLKTARREDIMCSWAEGADTECVNHLVNRIRMTTRKNSSKRQGSISWQTAGSRWFFVGDSTINVMYHLTLNKTLHSTTRPCPEASCQRLFAPRNGQVWKLFDHELPNVWRRANHTLGEGPCHRGYTNSSLQDCTTCDWDVNLCTNIEKCQGSTTQGASGGYIGVEFARDVEVQSEKYSTTQENFAHWLEEKWNTPSLVQALDRPICVLATGMHDQAIPNMTTPLFLKNARWYLHLMAPQCSHIIWLDSNTPRSNKQPQKKLQTKQWNDGILDILVEDFPHQSSYVSVYEASKTAGHSDNIHMRRRWYLALGAMFRTVINTLPLPIENNNNNNNNSDSRNGTQISVAS